MKTEEIKLGYIVRDRVTGFKGMVTIIETIAGSCSKAVIQPPVNAKGEMPDTASIDLPALEITSKKRFSETELPPMKWEFGQEVEDIMSGLKGKLIARSVHLNGCVQWAIQPPHLAKREKLIGGMWIPEAYVKAIGKKLPVAKERTRTGSSTRSGFESQLTSSARTWR